MQKTAKDSFRGTATSLVQHSTSGRENCGNVRKMNVIDESIVKQRSVQEFPEYYTSVQQVVFKNNAPVIQNVIGPVRPLRDDNELSLSKELVHVWLNKVSAIFETMN